MRGDSPELPGGPCTHQPASPWEMEGAATGPRAPGPQRLGEAGRTRPWSFRRPPASTLTSCLEAERAQFWWFTLLWPPHGPQTEPTTSQAHPLIRPSLGLRVPGPPGPHVALASFPQPACTAGSVEQAQCRPCPTAQTPNCGVSPASSQRSWSGAMPSTHGGSVPGQQASPCQVPESSTARRQALGRPPQVGSLEVRAGLTALAARSDATQREGRLALNPPRAVPLARPDCLSRACWGTAQTPAQPAPPARTAAGMPPLRTGVVCPELGSGGAGPAGTMARPGPWQPGWGRS